MLLPGETLTKAEDLLSLSSAYLLSNVHRQDFAERKDRGTARIIIPARVWRCKVKAVPIDCRERVFEEYY